MLSDLKSVPVIAASLALGAAAMSAAPAIAQNNTSPVVTAQLKGVMGYGKFTAVVDTENTRMCYMLNVLGLQNVTAAHIRRGPSAAGADVIDLKLPEGGSSGDCVPIETEMGEAMIDNPDAYEVSVATTLQPQGAVTGELQL